MAEGCANSRACMLQETPSLRCRWLWRDLHRGGGALPLAVQGGDGRSVSQ